MELQRAYPDLQTRGLGLAAISYDSPEILKAFADKHAITFPLLSDTGSSVIRKYNLLNAAATGKTAGIPHPGTFVLDTRGAVVSRSFEESYQNRQTVGSILADLPPEGGSHASVKGGGSHTGTTKDTAHLTVTTSASDEAAAPGHKVSLLVDVSPKPKMHVYAPGQEGYLAITLTLDADPAFTAGKATYPAGEKLFMQILNETQLVYAKPFRIVQDVTLALTREMRQRAALRLSSGQAAAGASLTIKGTLRYQACDDKICYLPANVPVEWALRLTPIQ